MIQHSIEFKMVNLSFGSKQVLHQANLTIAPGELVYLLGANGAGKSCLFNLAAGRLQPQGGTTTVTGTVAYHEQKPVFLHAMTALENLAAFNELFQCGRNKAHLQQLLHDTGLGGAEQPLANNMSGGEKQRLSLAITLLRDKDIYLFDEADSAMDPKGRKYYHSVLKTLCQKGKTVIWISHHVKESIALAGRCCYLKNGNVQEVDAKTVLQNASALITDEDIYNLLDKKEVYAELN